MNQLLIFFILLLFPASVTAQEQVVDTLQVGDVAPHVYLRTLDGKDFFLRDYCGALRSPKKRPQVVVFSFFATWCIPCRREIPHLMKLQERYRAQDMRIFLVDVGEEPKKVEKFIGNVGVALPVLMDRYSVVSQKYNVQGLPTLIVIGKDGYVKAMRSGYSDGDEQKVETILKELL